jgi:hypothetical protein
MLELGWFCASKNKTKKFPQNLNWPHVNCNSYFSITKIQTKIYPLPWLKISVFWINFWNWSDEWRIQRKYCFWIFNCCPTSTRNYVFVNYQWIFSALCVQFLANIDNIWQCENLRIFIAQITWITF